MSKKSKIYQLKVADPLKHEEESSLRLRDIVREKEMAFMWSVHGQEILSQ